MALATRPSVLQRKPSVAFPGDTPLQWEPEVFHSEFLRLTDPLSPKNAQESSLTPRACPVGCHFARTAYENFFNFHWFSKSAGTPKRINCWDRLVEEIIISVKDETGGGAIWQLAAAMQHASATVHDSFFRHTQLTQINPAKGHQF